jgi:mono/diheme cytochrome c family protein
MEAGFCQWEDCEMKRIVYCFAVAALPGVFLLFWGTAQAETLLERGTYLMKGVVACGNCHTPKDRGRPIKSKEQAGGFKFDEKPFTAYASNITPDKETGIGKWTDAQIIRAIREGIRPDGSIIGPPMAIPFFRHMSDRDVKAIVVYLRQVKPVKNKVPKSVYRIKLPPAYGPPVKSVPEVSRTDKVKYGEYLAQIGHCMDCHSPMGERGRDMTRIGAGGFPFHGPWGTVFAANITPDKATGIGNWTDRQIKAAITNGVRKDGTKMLPPMAYAWYRNIKPADLDALVAYLRSLKPLPAVRKVRHVPPKKK